MRTLKLEKSGKLIINQSVVDFSSIENRSEFLSSILLLDIELDDDITVADLIHFFYDSKEIILSLFSEEYEVVRALVTSSTSPFSCKKIRFYKSFKIEEEEDGDFVYMTPEIELIPDEDGISNIGHIPIFIDENIELEQLSNNSESNLKIKSKTKLTLLDLMTCLFDELPYLIKEGFVK